MSSYNIISIRDQIPKKKKYFIDASVWILILMPPTSVKRELRDYIVFFENIVNFRRRKNNALPLIILNTVLISEIINRYLRREFTTWDQALKERGDNKKRDFKKDFRHTNNYDRALQNFKNDFLVHKDILLLQNDNAQEIDLINLVEQMPNNQDFNDYFYYTYCRENDIDSIITHDGDFIFSNIEILTNHRHLLSIS